MKQRIFLSSFLERAYDVPIRRQTCRRPAICASARKWRPRRGGGGMEEICRDFWDPFHLIRAVRRQHKYYEESDSYH